MFRTETVLQRQEYKQEYIGSIKARILTQLARLQGGLNQSKHEITDLKSTGNGKMICTKIQIKSE